MRKLTASLLITGAAALAVGVTVPITIAATAPAPSTSLCVTEDAEGPCYWDATTQGNGQGESFYVDAYGSVFYLPTAQDTTCSDQLASIAERALTALDYSITMPATDAESARVDNLLPIQESLTFTLDNVC